MINLKEIISVLYKNSYENGENNMFRMLER